jgi:hypothetical protein
MGPIGCPETSVLKQPTLLNNPKNGRIEVNRRKVNNNHNNHCPVLISVFKSRIVREADHVAGMKEMTNTIK